MSFIKKLSVCIGIAFLTMNASAHAIAQQTNPPAVINQKQAIARAQQQVGGRVLKVESGPLHYRIKLLRDNGRVVTVRVNNQTGKLQLVRAINGKKGK